MKNKKAIICIMFAILIIGLIIIFFVTSNIKRARLQTITVNLTTVKLNSIYILNKVGVSTSNMQEKTNIYDDSVVFVLYDDGNWVFGIELDKNADKIKRIYGSEAKKCETLFREEFKNKLASDFKVQ